MWYIFEAMAAIILLVALFYSAHIIQKKWAPDIIHPYTKKPNKEMTYGIIRVGICCIAGLIMLLLTPILGGILLLAAGIFFMQIWFLKKKKEQILLEITYSEAEQETWKNEFKNIKGFKYKTKVTSKIVITDQYVYFSKNKRKSFIKKSIDNIRFESAEMSTSFLKLKYMYTGFHAETWFVYVPKDYEKKVLLLLKNKK